MLRDGVNQRILKLARCVTTISLILIRLRIINLLLPINFILKAIQRISVRMCWCFEWVACCGCWAKSPTAASNVNYSNAVGQIKRYERNAFKLFWPNCFNIATDGLQTVYGGHLCRHSIYVGVMRILRSKLVESWKWPWQLFSQKIVSRYRT